MPASFPRHARTARSLRAYLRIYESSEGLRLGISSRQILGYRQRNLIAVLDNAMSLLSQPGTHDVQTLPGLRNPTDFMLIGAQFDPIEFIL